jgi:hypothetical protein
MERICWHQQTPPRMDEMMYPDRLKRQVIIFINQNNCDTHATFNERPHFEQY